MKLDITLKISENNNKNSSNNNKIRLSRTNEQNIKQKSHSKKKPLIIQIHNSFNPFHKNNLQFHFF